MPDLALSMNPNERFKFKHNDWCWLGLYGLNPFYIHVSMAADFAKATQNFNVSDMYKRRLAKHKCRKSKKEPYYFAFRPTCATFAA